MGRSMIWTTTPGDTDADDAALVTFLHTLSADAAAHREYDVAAKLRDAAVALDEYRAGLRLANPAMSTGYVLIPMHQEAA